MPHRLDFDLPGKRAFLNQPGGGLCLSLESFSQSLLLPIVKVFRLCQFVAGKGQENQLHYKSLNTSSIVTVSSRPSS